MKIKADYIKTETIDGMFMVVPVGDESMKEHRVIELNETAAAIYDGIEKGLDESAIAALLAAEYGVSGEKALRDVKTVVQKLTDAGVIESGKA